MEEGIFFMEENIPNDEIKQTKWDYQKLAFMKQITEA